MVISGITGVTTHVTPSAPAQVDSAVVEQVENKTKTKDVANLMDIETYVRQYFADIPIMIQVAKCESRFKQFDTDGSIHRGIANPADVGVMQINEHYHLDTSVKQNYNIYTLEGNMAYGRELYEEKGTQPWSSSKACWGKMDPTTPTANTLQLAQVTASAK